MLVFYVAHDGHDVAQNYMLTMSTCTRMAMLNRNEHVAHAEREHMQSHDVAKHGMLHMRNMLHMLNVSTCSRMTCPNMACCT